MGDAFAPSTSRKKSALERRCCGLDCIRQLTGHAPATIPRTPPPSIFAECCQPPLPDHLHDGNWHLCSCQLLGCKEQHCPSCDESRSGRRCSNVMPDGPPADPSLEEHNVLKKRRSSTRTALDGGSSDPPGSLREEHLVSELDRAIPPTATRKPSVTERDTFGAWRISLGSIGRCGNVLTSGSTKEEFATCGGRVPDKNRGGRLPSERNNIIKNRDTNDTQVNGLSNKFQCHRVQRWRACRQTC